MRVEAGSAHELGPVPESDQGADGVGKRKHVLSPKPAFSAKNFSSTAKPSRVAPVSLAGSSRSASSSVQLLILLRRRQLAGEQLEEVGDAVDGGFPDEYLDHHACDSDTSTDRDDESVLEQKAQCDEHDAKRGERV